MNIIMNISQRHPLRKNLIRGKNLPLQLTMQDTSKVRRGLDTFPVPLQPPHCRKNGHLESVLRNLTTRTFENPVEGLIEPIRIAPWVAKVTQAPKQMKRHMPLWDLQLFESPSQGYKPIEMIERGLYLTRGESPASVRPNQHHRL